MGVNGPEPSFGTGEKRKRRDDDQAAAMVQAAKPGPDQPHVMVQRQPTDKDIVIGDFGYLAHGTDVGKEVGMGEDHTLGVSGRTRCVLDKGDVLGSGRYSYNFV